MIFEIRNPRCKEVKLSAPGIFFVDFFNGPDKDQG